MLERLAAGVLLPSLLLTRRVKDTCSTVWVHVHLKLDGNCRLPTWIVSSTIPFHSKPSPPLLYKKPWKWTGILLFAECAVAPCVFGQGRVVCPFYTAFPWSMTSLCFYVILRRKMQNEDLFIVRCVVIISSHLFWPAHPIAQYALSLYRFVEHAHASTILQSTMQLRRERDGSLASFPTGLVAGRPFTSLEVLNSRWWAGIRSPYLECCVIDSVIVRPAIRSKEVEVWK